MCELRNMFYGFMCFCIWLLNDLKLLHAVSQNSLHLKQNSSLSTVNSGLSAVQTDEPEMISVMEGTSVTLNTGVKVDKNDQILWTFRFKNSDARIAEIHKQSIYMYDDDENNERFKDRLLIDEQTGSLTITNINKLHSGLYKVQVIKRDIKHKSFSIAVYALLTVPVITDSPQNPSVSERSSSQSCSLVCSVFNVSAVSLSWYKGNHSLSSISVSDLSISLSLPLELECLDDSYSCVVSYSFTNQTTHLNITQLCRECSDGRLMLFRVLIIIAVSLAVLTAVVVVMICRRKSLKAVAQESQNTEEEVNYIDTTFDSQRAQEMEINVRNETEYSAVVLT